MVTQQILVLYFCVRIAVAQQINKYNLYGTYLLGCLTVCLICLALIYYVFKELTVKSVILSILAIIGSWVSIAAGGLIGILVLVQFMQDGDDIPLWKRD